jgi:hypothetical protein
MASTVWGQKPAPTTPELFVSILATWSVGRRGTFDVESSIFKPGDTIGISAVVLDESSQPTSGAQVFMDIGVKDQPETIVTSIQGFSDSNGIANLTWKTSKREPAGTYGALIKDIIKSGYIFNSSPDVPRVIFDIR